MKKLLVLMLVLGLTSAANAALSFYIDGSDAGTSIEVAQGATVTIQIYSSDTSDWLAYTGMDISTMSAFGSVGGEATNSTNAGTLGGITPYYELGWMDGFEATTAAGSVPSEVLAGVQHSFVYTAPMSDGSTRMGIFRPATGYSWDADELDVLAITVPEPMTIALLGLGGLFLCRRKK